MLTASPTHGGSGERMHRHRQREHGGDGVRDPHGAPIAHGADHVQGDDRRELGHRRRIRGQAVGRGQDRRDAEHNQWVLSTQHQRQEDRGDEDVGHARRDVLALPAAADPGSAHAALLQ